MSDSKIMYSKDLYPADLVSKTAALTYLHHEGDILVKLLWYQLELINFA